MACEDVDRPIDDPREFARETRYAVNECEDGRAYPESQVGPIGVALFLGAPSRAYPTEGR